jgi:tetraacyldisaccharide 4'-kinase
MSWYNPSWTDYLGLPFSWGFQLITQLRRRYLIHFRQKKCPVPIIVVGNITVGGVGKTPLVIALADYFCAQGLKVGIVSRGYRAGMKKFPYAIQETDTAEQVGDEPLLIFKKTQCPVVIAPQRVKAVTYLLQYFACQVIISDDGLQHYRMGRAVEIAVIDGLRGLGNGLCLPMGPLRESERRLQQVDYIVVNGDSEKYKNAYQMYFVPGALYPLLSLSVGEDHRTSAGDESLDVEIDLNVQSVTFAAVAGIGNPQRFLNTLNDLGLNYRPYIFPDHYFFSVDDFSFSEKNIVMTEKDAVKCLDFATNSMYVLPIRAQLAASFWQSLASHEQLKGLFG